MELPASLPYMSLLPFLSVARTNGGLLSSYTRKNPQMTIMGSTCLWTLNYTACTTINSPPFSKQTKWSIHISSQSTLGKQMPSSSPHVLGQCFLCILSHADLCLDLVAPVCMCDRKIKKCSKRRHRQRQGMCVSMCTSVHPLQTYEMLQEISQ